MSDVEEVAERPPLEPRNLGPEFEAIYQEDEEYEAGDEDRLEPDADETPNPKKLKMDD